MLAVNPSVKNEGREETIYFLLKEEAERIILVHEVFMLLIIIRKLVHATLKRSVDVPVQDKAPFSAGKKEIASFSLKRKLSDVSAGVTKGDSGKLIVELPQELDGHFVEVTTING